MKDFAGSSITYYGLAREKLTKKYPRLISVLIILALICTTGLAIFLISDLVSFALNPDYKGASLGLDIKGLESGISSAANGKEKSGIISTNSSLASLSSNQTAKGGAATGKSSSSSSQNSVNQKSGNNPVAMHHSSSSSSSSRSSSKSSSANSAKKSSDMNNLTNETATNQSINSYHEQEPALMNATDRMNLSQTDIANSTVSSSNLSSNGQAGALSDKSNLAATEGLSSLSSIIGSITDPAKNTPAREPVSIIKFKTEKTLSPGSEPSQSAGDSANTGGSSVSDNSNKAQSSTVPTKNIKFKAADVSTSSKQSKLTASSQAAKIKEAKEKMKAKKDRIEQAMKDKAAQLRSKAA